MVGGVRIGLPCCILGAVRPRINNGIAGCVVYLVGACPGFRGNFCIRLRLQTTRLFYVKEGGSRFLCDGRFLT